MDKAKNVINVHNETQRRTFKSWVAGPWRLIAQKPQMIITSHAKPIALVLSDESIKHRMRDPEKKWVEDSVGTKNQWGKKKLLSFLRNVRRPLVLDGMTLTL
jgi:hypothetical protein